MLNGGNLKKIRMENNLSQNDIAKILNVARSGYAMWESGYNIIPIKQLIALADYFHISVDYILALNSNKTIIKNSINQEKIKIRIKEFRKENNLNQEQLAASLYTTKSVISGYETGRYIIATPFLYSICKNYNISADYLLGRTNEPKNINIKKESC